MSRGLCWNDLVSNVEPVPLETICTAEPGHEIQILPPRVVPLGGPRAMDVRRVLPQRKRSLIGAWCFLDSYGLSRSRPQHISYYVLVNFSIGSRYGSSASEISRTCRNDKEIYLNMAKTLKLSYIALSTVSLMSSGISPMKIQ